MKDKKAPTKIGRTKETQKEDKKAPTKIELWQETSDKEEITVIRAEGTTAKINRKKLADAMNKIINDPTIRSKLETDPAGTMAELGIEIDDKEKAAIAGKRLSESIAYTSAAGVREGPAEVPTLLPFVAVHIGVRTINSPQVEVAVAVGTEPVVGSSVIGGGGGGGTGPYPMVSPHIGLDPHISRPQKANDSGVGQDNSAEI